MWKTCIWIIVIILVVGITIFMYRNRQETNELYTNIQEIMTDAYKKNLHRELDPVSANHYKDISRFIFDFSSYVDAVARGERIAHKRSLVICGLIKDCEELVDDIILLYKSFKDVFSSVKLIVVENDSKDMTREYLLKYELQEPESIFILCPGSRPGQKHCSIPSLNKTESPVGSPNSSRIKKMSFLRNTYLEFLRSEEYFPFPDYVLVIDLDLDGMLYMDGIMHSIDMMEMDHQLDAVASNGMQLIERSNFRYYDTFAHVDINDEIIIPSLHDKGKRDKYLSQKKTDQYSTNWTPDIVRSAFGGAALYNKNALLPPHHLYDHTVDGIGFSCEHSHLHDNFHKMVVNPRMIFLISTNSSYSHNVIKQLKNRTKKQQDTLHED